MTDIPDAPENVVPFKLPVAAEQAARSADGDVQIRILGVMQTLLAQIELLVKQNGAIAAEIGRVSALIPVLADLLKRIVEQQHRDGQLLEAVAKEVSALR